MDTFASIYKLIQRYDTITIWGHAMPDGDCYGCQIGLREILRASFPDKKVYAIGSGIPSLFRRMVPMDKVDEETIASSLGILVDVSCLRRVEDQRVNLCKAWTKFDHHRPNRGKEVFPYRPCYVDHNKIAAAEILTEFALKMKLPIPVLAAEALYLGMATDSGKFRFFGTTERTKELAKKLIDLGAEPQSILDIVYHEDEVVKAFRGYLRSRINVEKNVAYVYLSRMEYQRQNVPYEIASSMVNALEGATPCPIYALFTEDSEGLIRVELRSDKNYPVHQTAVKFGGGGHQFASGLTIAGTIPDYRDVIADLNTVKPSYNGVEV